jgi:hypothetical protein
MVLGDLGVVDLGDNRGWSTDDSMLQVTTPTARE